MTSFMLKEVQVLIEWMYVKAQPGDNAGLCGLQIKG